MAVGAAIRGGGGLPPVGDIISAAGPTCWACSAFQTRQFMGISILSPEPTQAFPMTCSTLLTLRMPVRCANLTCLVPLAPSPRRQVWRQVGTYHKARALLSTSMLAPCPACVRGRTGEPHGMQATPGPDKLVQALAAATFRSLPERPKDPAMFV